jgi:hypothetical protein
MCSLQDAVSRPLPNLQISAGTTCLQERIHTQSHLSTVESSCGRTDRLGNRVSECTGAGLGVDVRWQRQPDRRR